MPASRERLSAICTLARGLPLLPAAGEQEAFQALLTAVETLKQQCAIPPQGRAAGKVSPRNIANSAMVPAAGRRHLRTNPRPVDGAAIAQLLENLQ